MEMPSRLLDTYADGGLLDRRTSVCRNGIGENTGTGVCAVLMNEVDALKFRSTGGKGEELHVDVTRSVFSTARRYLSGTR